MEVITKLVDGSRPHVERLFDRQYAEGFEMISQLVKNIPRYDMGQYSIKIFTSENYIDVLDSLKSHLEGSDFRVWTYFYGAITRVVLKKHTFLEIVKINTTNLTGHYRPRVRISSIKNNGFTYLHPKYLMLKEFENLCNPSYIEDDKTQEYLDEWYKHNPEDFKGIYGGSEEDIITQDVVLDCPYSSNIYLGKISQAPELQKTLGSDYTKLNGVTSPLNIRMEFLVFYKDKRRIAKMWTTMDKELIMVDPSGRLHIDCVLRHALADHINAELFEETNRDYLARSLRNFFNMYNKRNKMIKNGTYTKKESCKFMGVNFPLEKEIAEKRLENISKKVNE